MYTHLDQAESSFSMHHAFAGIPRPPVRPVLSLKTDLQHVRGIALAARQQHHVILEVWERQFMHPSITSSIISRFAGDAGHL